MKFRLTTQSIPSACAGEIAPGLPPFTPQVHHNERSGLMAPRAPAMLEELPALASLSRPPRPFRRLSADAAPLSLREHQEIFPEERGPPGARCR